MVEIPPQLKTVGHVLREISRHIFFFLKEENGKVDGFIYSTQYTFFYKKTIFLPEPQFS